MTKESAETGGTFVERIRLGERLGYGLGDFASNLLFASLNTFIVIYFIDVAGIAAVAVGTILLVSRIFDGLSDVIMGVIVDRTRSRFGKARPWLLYMAIPFAATLILIFIPNNFSPLGKIIYAFVTYNLATTFVYTAINIPYGALTALITHDQTQRTFLNIFRMLLAGLGAILVNVATMPLVQMFGGGATGYLNTFIIYGISGAVLFLVCFLSIRERVTAQPASYEKHATKEGFKGLLKNKPWVIMVAVGIATFIINGLGGGNVYFAQYYLGNPALIGPLMIAQFVPALGGLFFVGMGVKKFGKRNIALVGCIVAIAGTAFQLIDPHNPVFVYTGMVIRGLGIAPLFGTFFAFLADTIVYGEWKTGLRTEGIVYSAGSFGTKAGSGLGGALVGWLLAWGHYVPAGATQPGSAMAAILWAFAWLPMIMFAVIVILLWFYDLDKKYPVIVAELEERATKEKIQ